MQLVNKKTVASINIFYLTLLNILFIALVLISIDRYDLYTIKQFLSYYLDIKNVVKRERNTEKFKEFSKKQFYYTLGKGIIFCKKVF